MITKTIISSMLTVVMAAACTDPEAEARRIKEDAVAKQRAAVVRKEMDVLPKAFKSPPFFRLNEPKKSPDTDQPAAKTPAP